MKKLSLLIGLLLTLAAHGQQKIIVYPGDANNNGLVNHYDLLHMAYGYLSTGPARTDSVHVNSTLWGPDTVLRWQLHAPDSGLNYGHFDCSGNGIVSAYDTNIIAYFYGQKDPLVFRPDSFLLATSNDPLLLLQTPQDTFQAGSSVSLSVVLGAPANGVDSLLGIGFSIFYDTALVEPHTMHFQPSNLWIGQGQGALLPVLQLQRDSFVAGRLDVAISRTNRQGISGSGSLGTVSFVMEDILVGKDEIVMSLVLHLGRVMALSHQLKPFPVYADSTTLMVTSIGRPAERLPLAIVPNPANQQLRLQIRANAIERIQVRTITGRDVPFQWHPAPGAEQLLLLPEGRAGIYFIEIYSHGKVYTGKVVVLE